MGLTIFSRIHQVEDIDIDIAACNAELRKSSFDEIYEGASDRVGYLHGDYPLLLKDDTLYILNSCDGYIEGWKSYTYDGGRMLLASKIIAKHLKSGKIVFYQEIEGNYPCFFVVTPGKVAEVNVKDMRF